MSQSGADNTEILRICLKAQILQISLILMEIGEPFVDFEDIIYQLNQNRLMKTDEEIDRFVEALDKVEKAKNHKMIPKLLLVFTDETDIPSVMIKLIDEIKDLNMDTLIEQFTILFPLMMPQAARWVRRIALDIFINEQNTQYFAECYSRAPQLNQDVIREFLETLRGYSLGSAERMERVIRAIDFVLKV